MLRTLALSLCLVTAPALARAANYDIDPMHSNVNFAVKHMMVTTVRGDFNKVQGSASWTKPDFSDATIEVTVDAASIDTHVAQRDAHLKSPDFFDVAKFPTITFKSKKAEKGSEAGHLKLVGELTLHGVTKEVTFDVTGPTPEIKGPMGTSVGASAVAKINREDFGLKWNKALEAGGVMVGKEVTLEINLELAKKVLKASK